MFVKVCGVSALLYVLNKRMLLLYIPYFSKIDKLPLFWGLLLLSPWHICTSWLTRTGCPWTRSCL